jgi:Flp pilus assembly pilin Flp
MDTSGKTGPRRVAQAGQGLVEYALILALIAAVAVVGTIFLGKQVSTVLSHTGSALGARSNGGTPVQDQPCGNGGHWDWHTGGGGHWTCDGDRGDPPAAGNTPEPSGNPPGGGTSGGQCNIGGNGNGHTHGTWQWVTTWTDYTWDSEEHEWVGGGWSAHWVCK